MRVLLGVFCARANVRLVFVYMYVDENLEFLEIKMPALSHTQRLPSSGSPGGPQRSSWDASERLAVPAPTVAAGAAGLRARCACCWRRALWKACQSAQTRAGVRFCSESPQLLPAGVTLG